MSAGVPLWVEWGAAALLVAGGLFSLVAALGLVRLKTFFQRMHPPALACTFSSWCVTLASILYFSASGKGLALHTWLIIIFLSITVPVTTLLLARAALFRQRQAGDQDTPPPLQPRL
ncbi:Na+/H+ antiporter subunit G [Variovorax terrae]|uniref:Na+/H+ antiporter subunit G n=1 Tax=Variovorax terrae TaxID=2923278 RepID=A0A9X2AP16_9BURK|nr:Na+/H+ antiporter subunit G [Variovorax terrae]MCJ0762982.1 Na+/H+ antiporter subunit G [Variovorax terrae]